MKTPRIGEMKIQTEFMTTIRSEKKSIQKSKREIASFLRNLNNLEKLMPVDKIDNWQSSEENCSFKIKGLAKIGMKLKTEESNKITLTSEGENPFDFTLDMLFDDTAGNDTEVQLEFNADMNSFTAMMVKKPLKNFFDMLVNNLAEQN